VSEEGHLDFFYANAGVIDRAPKKSSPGERTKQIDDQMVLEQAKRSVRRMQDIGSEEFMEVIRINTLRQDMAIRLTPVAI
jgi:hypothetical protein